MPLWIVGRWAATSQRLQDIIKQHVLKSIHYGTSSPKRDLSICKCKYSTKSTTQIQSLGTWFHHWTSPPMQSHLRSTLWLTACSPFSQMDVCHFIFQLLKPPSLKLPTLFSADKKNLFITWKFRMFLLSFELTAYSFAVMPIGYLPITARLLL